MIDVFKIGVNIAMTSNASQVLNLMMKQFTGVNTAATSLQGKLGGLQKTAVILGAAFAAWEIGKIMLHAVEHASKLNHELVKLQIGMRLTDQQTNAESVSAFDISRRVPGTNVVDLVKQKRELSGTLGSLENANKVAELVAQGSAAVSSYVDKDTDLAKVAVRALEIRGQVTKDHKVDPAMFAKEFDNMVRAIVASEGLLDPAKLLQFIQQAGPAARGMSAEAMWGEAPAVMNALGSSKAGTALNSMFAQFIGHVVAGKRVAIAMEEAGMLTPGKWNANTRGGKVIMDKDAVPNQAGFAEDPFAWMHEKLEAMRAKGKDTVGLMQEIFQLGSRSTTQRLISDIDANWAVIENEKRRFNKMPGVKDIAKEQNDKDVEKNVKNLSDAWSNFMTTLGGPAASRTIGILKWLTDEVNYYEKGIIDLDNSHSIQDFIDSLKIIPVEFNKLTAWISNFHITMPGWLGGGSIGPGKEPFGPPVPPVIGRHGPGAFQKSSADDELYNNRVVKVAIVNPHDIGHAISGGMASGLERQPSGPTGFDARMTQSPSAWSGVG